MIFGFCDYGDIKNESGEIYTCLYLYICRYNTDGVDFTPSVGCIIRAIEGSMRKADISCSYVDQSKGVLTLTNTEELVSNIIEVKQVEEDRTFSVSEMS